MIIFPILQYQKTIKFSRLQRKRTPKMESAEISVDTAASYQNKGFASSAVTKAAEYLLLHGYKVSYVAFSDQSEICRTCRKMRFYPEIRML